MPDKNLSNIRIKHDIYDDNGSYIERELVIKPNESYYDKDGVLHNDGTDIKIIEDPSLFSSHVSLMDNKQVITKIDSEIKKITKDCSKNEYDNLPISKRTDNKLYFIYDNSDSEKINEVYGFHIDPTESDPSDAVTYLALAMSMTPAKMGETTFSYGSWADAFFMPKPCMVKCDGTVDYYLDPNDYTKKLDGTASDVANLNYDGNAMMEWPLIWYKYDTEGMADGEYSFYVSNKQIDENYRCWCNYDADGNIIPHFYTAIYNGTCAPNYSTSRTYEVGDRVSRNGQEYTCKTAITTPQQWTLSKWNLEYRYTRMRSLSGVAITRDNGNGYLTVTAGINRCLSNNKTTSTEWFTDILVDRQLISMLLVLIGKSLDTQSVFGMGLTVASVDEKQSYITGTLNDKGLFWGNTSNSTNAVKVFGMENFWGAVNHQVAGLINNKIKLTHSTVDGSTTDAFNTNGNGYIPIPISKISVGGFLTKMAIVNDTPIPILAGGTSSTYYCDYVTLSNPYLVCGGYNQTDKSGAFYCESVSSTNSNYTNATTLSLKPLISRFDT